MVVIRILIIDDDDVMLRAVSRILHHNGYEVLSAANPREALELFKNRPPIHLVVSDNHMPEGQGTHLVREILRLSPQTACLMMTGGGITPEDTPEGVTVLKKPFRTADLIDAVQAALARSWRG